MKKTYIITGANGFLGNNIIRKLVAKEDCEIRALIKTGDAPVHIGEFGCKIFYGDVTKKETLNDLFDVEEGSDVCVIHCAAVVYIKSKKNPYVGEVNVGGVENIVEQTLKIGAKLVHVSSVHAVPELPNQEQMTEVNHFDPSLVHGIYAKSKASGTEVVLKAVREKGLNVCIVQPSGILGPYDFGNTHMTEMIVQFANGKLPAGVKGKYDFVDVRDVADGVIAAIDKGRKGECYLLTNRQVYIKEILDYVSETLGIKKIKLMIPIWIAKLAAPFCEAYYSMRKKTPLFTSYSLYTVLANSNFNHEKAEKELGYKTRDFKETVTDTVLWLKECGRIKER